MMDAWERRLRRKQRAVVIVEWLMITGIVITLWQCGAAIWHAIRG